MTAKYPRCGHCGGSVVLSSGENRQRQLYKGIHIDIPDSFLIPTCLDCYDEYMDPSTSQKLDTILYQIIINAIAAEFNQIDDGILQTPHPCSQMCWRIGAAAPTHSGICCECGMRSKRDDEKTQITYGMIRRVKTILKKLGCVG